MNIGLAIRFYRKRYKHLSQHKLASKIKLGKTQISKLELKPLNFTIITLLEICKGLDIDITDLLNKAKEYD